jgi:general secretion pathway protein K
LHRSIAILRRSMSALRDGARRAHARRLSRQSGFALLVVMTTVAVLGAVVGEFGYNARVELEAAANARDTLRAEYMARSGVQLSRLLIKVQQSVVDTQLNRMLGTDFQIIDFAPLLLAPFSGSDDEKKAFGDLIGIDTTGIKGLGVSKGASFDVLLGVEDGKININCGGGLPRLVQGQAPAPSPASGAGTSSAAAAAPGRPLPPSVVVYNMLLGAMYPVRYNRLFEIEHPDGQFYTRDDVARAVIDWTDIDEGRFDPIQIQSGNSSSAAEDYRYDTLRDPYKARNNFFDTTEELNLVKGVTDDIWGSFGSMFTVYGGCKLNLRAVSADNWPILAAVVRAAAQNPQDPVLLDDTIVAAMSQQVVGMAMMLPGAVMNLQSFINALKNGGMPQITPPTGAGAAPLTLTPLFPGLPGITLDPNKLGMIARIGQIPREVYRIESTGSIKRAGSKKIEVRVRAIFDTQTFNQNTTSGDRNDLRGSWLYWRME